MESGNAAKAARDAGYAPNYGRKLVKTRAMREYLSAREKPEGGIASIDEVMSHISSILRGAEKEVPTREQLKAAEVLIKYHGNLSGDLGEGIPIIINNADELED